MLDNREKTEYEKGFEIGRALASLPCPARKDDQAIRGFIDGVLRQHRTHQQNIFRSLLLLFRVWKDEGEKGWFDDRNKATVKGADKILESLKDHGVPYI
jgi:hypothetical protein